MNENTITEEVLDFFKAMANVERIKIMGLIANEQLTIAEIAARLHMKPINIQHHLGQLASTGLAKSSDNTYHLDEDKIINLSRQVLQGSRPKLKDDDFEGEAYERKVLKDFFSADGRLTAIPAQNKKRLVVLRHLAKAFEPGATYPEKQVNEILRRYHPDTASLRRYLVDEGLLTRENGIYWRI
jgi:hypothetical protein